MISHTNFHIPAEIKNALADKSHFQQRFEQRDHSKGTSVL